MATNSKYVHAKVIPGNAADFVYPETTIPAIAGRQNWGLAFSGGGTRSASLTLGQLRALKHLGLLDQFRYCSSVSGGTWGLTPYIFLDSSIEDDEFLGVYKDPSALTLGDIRSEDPKSLATAIADSGIFKHITGNIFKGDELFSRIIGDIFLNRFLLNSNSFFTLNDETLGEILQRNERLTYDDFYTVSERNRPYLIVNTTILRSVELRIPFEMTPLYCGIRKLYPRAGAHQKFDIGGGFIEPHGFDSDAPEAGSEGPYRQVRLDRRRLTISDMLGSSGAAPADFFRRSVVLPQIFPNFSYWSPLAQGDQLRGKTYDFGDGGLLENLGIMPLLRRKVAKIIVFINGKTLITKTGTDEYDLSSSIPALFKKLKNQYGDHDFDKNIVFDNSQNQFLEVAESLFRKQQVGKPTVHVGRYHVVDNSHHDITGGWEVDVCWVYNSLPEDWKKTLPYEIKVKLENNDFGKDFPHFNTFMENFPYLVDLNIEQAHLASNLSAWMLVESRNEIEHFLNA